MHQFFVTLLLALHLLLPLAAAAEVKVPKDPFSFSLKYYGMILGIALLGGAVNWYRKLRAGEVPAWSVQHLVGELAASAFAGLICFWLCEWADAPPLLTAPLTGLCGHMGTRAITMFEEWAKGRFSQPKVTQ